MPDLVNRLSSAHDSPIEILRALFMRSTPLERYRRLDSYTSHDVADGD